MQTGPGDATAFRISFTNVGVFNSKLLRSLTQSCNHMSREANEQRAQDEIPTQYTWSQVENGGSV